MNKTYKVTLTSGERRKLFELVSTGKSNAVKIKHANMVNIQNLTNRDFSTIMRNRPTHRIAGRRG